MEAFGFIQEGLRYTVEKLGREEQLEAAEGRHVSGQELCLGLREFAIEQYGLLARTVLRSWNVRSTEDFGRLVFAMVEAGVLRTSHEDSIDDFTGIYDFDEAFSAESLAC
jgi:uncharacterized repeat protein (TIGR04138 family)